MQKRRGFTIVELIVVIVIIGILSAIVVVSYSGIRTRAAATTLKSDVEKASIQLEKYRADHGAYPATEALANDGEGLSKSSGTTYQYAVDGSYYCISASSTSAGSTIYHTTSTSGTAKSGECPINAFGGIDSYTKLALHTDGTDTSTTFTDSELTPKTVTPVGTAQIDTAQSKFNGASGLFDGNSDYIRLADSSDWAFSSGDFTIDCWSYLNEAMGAATRMIFFYGSNTVSWGTDGINFLWKIDINKRMYFYYNNGAGGAVEIPATGDLAISSAWHHLAVVKYGGIITLYVDGTSVGSSAGHGTLFTTTGTKFLNVGVSFSGSQNDYWNGWIDEFRVSKGIARWTTNFTPPTQPYSI